MLNNGQKKETIYVTLSSRKAIFLVTGKIKETKNSYTVPIIPLHGYYYSSKHKRSLTADELRGYHVILSVPKKKIDFKASIIEPNVVVVGYYEYEVFVHEPDKEELDEEEEREEESEEKADNTRVSRK